MATFIEDGGCHGWHFDSNEFVVSLMLRDAERGGKFEYVPNLRSSDDERYEHVASVLEAIGAML